MPAGQVESWWTCSPAPERRGDTLVFRLPHGASERLGDDAAWTGTRRWLEDLEPPAKRFCLSLVDEDEVLLETALPELQRDGLRLVDLCHAAGRLELWLELRPIDGPPVSPSGLALMHVETGAFHELPTDREILVGRSREAELQLASSHASGQHALLRFARRAVGVVDLHSGGGTWLDNRRIRRAVVDRFGLLCLGRKETGRYLEAEIRIPVGESAFLHVISGEHTGKVLPLLHTSTLVGRSKSCDQRILASFVSRRHLRLTLLEDVMLAFDLGSGNGTFLNDRPVLCERILPGDHLRFADEEFEVLDERLLRADHIPPGAALRIGDRNYPLDQSILTLGRGGECEICLPDSRLSRRQTRFIWYPGPRLKLFDLAGPVAAQVNGEVVSTAEFRPGDVLKVGDLEATYVMPEDGHG